MNSDFLFFAAFGASLITFLVARRNVRGDDIHRRSSRIEPAEELGNPQ